MNKKIKRSPNFSDKFIETSESTFIKFEKLANDDFIYFRIDDEINVVQSYNPSWAMSLEIKVQKRHFVVSADKRYYQVPSSKIVERMPVSQREGYFAQQIKTRANLVCKFSAICFESVVSGQGRAASRLEELDRNAQDIAELTKVRKNMMKYSKYSNSGGFA